MPVSHDFASPPAEREWQEAASSRERTLVVGAAGQLGRALQGLWLGRDDVDFVDREVLDVGAHDSIAAFDFSPYRVIVNAAGYTDKDGAESAEGRREAWAVNAKGVALLVSAAREAGAVLVHISSDYVFDGSVAFHTEEEGFAPLGVYGQTKAAGDAAVSTLDTHYILRTSWVVGEGKNFVATMREHATNGDSPSVVNDQFGRLTFTDEIARAIDFVLRTRVPFGTYNVTNSGDITSWFEIAQRVYELTGHDPENVQSVSSAEYLDTHKGIALRPINSALDLSKITEAGFHPRDQFEALAAYLA